jgi:hypothetical protein
VVKCRGKWRASITAFCVTNHLGTFDDPAEAARAYDKAALELHGSEAKLNFPEARSS